jgi:hypothetical protein
MPQLDVSTYLGQVTWFAVVFTRFYLAVVTDVLPALNRAVKMRAKKLDRTRGDARQFDSARRAAEDGYDHASAVTSKHALGILTHARARATSAARKRRGSIHNAKRAPVRVAPVAVNLSSTSHAAVTTDKVPARKGKKSKS